MPFQSKAQMKAAFGGYLGPEMKAKAHQWAHETPDIKSLPNKKSSKGKKKTRELGSRFKSKSSGGSMAGMSM